MYVNMVVHHALLGAVLAALVCCTRFDLCMFGMPATVPTWHAFGERCSYSYVVSAGQELPLF